MRDVRTARSLLFVPGTRPDRYGKAVAAGADGVVIDLEDAVAQADKASARDAVAGWLRGDGAACVRINGAQQPEHEADLAAVGSVPGLVACVVPKVEDPAVVSRVAAETGRPVIGIVESALGLYRVHELAQAAGMARLAFGHLDYSQDLGSGAGREAMATARSAVVLASRVAGLPGPLDGVTPQVDQPGRAGEDAAYAREMGFTGKLLIHPRQVGPVHAAMTPSDEEVAWAQRVLTVAESGEGVGRVEGQMVDAPVIARARRILDTPS